MKPIRDMSKPINRRVLVSSSKTSSNYLETIIAILVVGAILARIVWML